MSTNSVKSSTIVVFPATRRNVLFYNSRIMSEDNYRRAIQSCMKVGGYSGTFIYKGSTRTVGDAIKLVDDRIEFFLEGYYIRLQGEDCEAIVAINNKLGQEGGTLWLYMRQVRVTNDDFSDLSPNFYQRFMELDCKDEALGADGVYSFEGLGWGEEAKDGYMNIPLIVPKNGTSGPGVLNPSLQLDEVYKPWFLSTAEWAASEFSDKNKIWVDDEYNVPHICVKSADILKWIPLGAVYKSSLKDQL